MSDLTLENKITALEGEKSFTILLAKEVAKALKLESKNLMYRIHNGCLIICRKNESENDSKGDFND
ncbi:MAG: hypothetical protein ACPKPY_08865 [Nitrososphaeraceae archaeon]